MAEVLGNSLAHETTM